MKKIQKVLCVCIGNSDRSPVMAAVLGMLLENAGHQVIVESAGVGESAAKGGPAAEFGVAAAKLIGLDISCHNRRRVTVQGDFANYDLIVCATDTLAGEVMSMGVPLSKICNARISNPWPVHFAQDYEETMMAIMGSMYRVVARYFPPPVHPADRPPHL
ncbi:MAG: hypothetical protein AAB610_00630 [Patescibacteria group bacterium]